MLDLGQLQDYLDENTLAAQKAGAKLQQNNPHLDQYQLQELVSAEWKSERENEQEKGLSPDAQEKLDCFKDKIQDALEAEAIVRPLAELLLRNDMLLEFERDLNRKLMDNLFRPELNQEQIEEAIRVLLWNYPFLLWSEDKEHALKVPEEDRGEVLLETIMANMSNEDH